MAVTRINPIHNCKRTLRSSIGDSVRYAVNPNKTDNGDNISSYGCDWHTATEEFYLQHKNYSRTQGKKNKNDVVAYHLIQSFKPGEISPEDANQVGYELASRLLKGRYDFVVSTHVDHLHVHNHIIFNAVSNDCKHKYRNKKNSIKEIQMLSDQICTEHHLSVIENPQRGRHAYNVWLENQKDRPQLLVDVNKALVDKGTGYRLWAAKHNIQQLALAYNFMRENNITDVESLDEVIRENNKRIVEDRNKARDIQKRFEDSIKLKNHLINYTKYKDVYVEYKKSGYSKKYYEEHKTEIEAIKEARAVFKEYEGEKLPSIKEITKQIEELKKEKDKAYTDLKKLVNDTKDLRNYADNIRTLLSEETDQKEKQQTKSTDKTKQAER